MRRVGPTPIRPLKRGHDGEVNTEPGSGSHKLTQVQVESGEEVEQGRGRIRMVEAEDVREGTEIGEAK